MNTIGLQAHNTDDPLARLLLRQKLLLEAKKKKLEEEDTAARFGDGLRRWVETTEIMLDGRPFSFKRHEYLIEPYGDNHPDQTEMKAAQLGLTSKAMLRTMWSAKYGNYRGILYLFPSRSDVLDFSKGRITPLINDNPDTIGSWVQETDAAGIKKIGDSFLYLRGMVSRVGLKSVPVDLIIFDELDEAPQRRVDMALERMSHSEYKEVLKLSNPTIPDYGIDKAFQQTDQKYWLLKCPSCGHYTCLEDTFPDCLRERKDKVIRVCERCEAELNPAVGEWVAKRPGAEKRGYHYSQLFSQFVSPKEILDTFRETTNFQDFYNLKIGIAYIEAQNRLSVEEVLALSGGFGIVSSDEGPCWMGVDQGRDLHVTIAHRYIGKLGGRISHIGVYRDWSELDRLMKVFNVARCVVDAQPETRNAREFAERHLGRVYLCYYREHQKGAYKWSDKDWTVLANRTESLDASHNIILMGQTVLPKVCEVTEEFALHLHNVAKKLEEEEDTGSKRYVYVKLGPDHFRHAFNYMVMAMHGGGESFFEGYDLSSPEEKEKSFETD